MERGTLTVQPRRTLPANSATCPQTTPNANSTARYERVAMRPRGVNMGAFCITRQHFREATSGAARMFGRHQTSQPPVVLTRHPRTARTSCTTLPADPDRPQRAVPDLLNTPTLLAISGRRFSSSLEGCRTMPARQRRAPGRGWTTRRGGRGGSVQSPRVPPSSELRCDARVRR